MFEKQIQSAQRWREAAFPDRTQRMGRFIGDVVQEQYLRPLTFLISKATGQDQEDYLREVEKLSLWGAHNFSCYTPKGLRKDVLILSPEERERMEGELAPYREVLDDRFTPEMFREYEGWAKQQLLNDPFAAWTILRNLEGYAEYWKTQSSQENRPLATFFQSHDIKAVLGIGITGLIPSAYLREIAQQELGKPIDFGVILPLEKRILAPSVEFEGVGNVKYEPIKFKISECIHTKGNVLVFDDSITVGSLTCGALRRALPSSRWQHIITVAYSGGIFPPGSDATYYLSEVIRYGLVF